MSYEKKADATLDPSLGEEPTEPVEAQPRWVKAFYLAPIRLAATSVVEPGNWGRLLRRYNTNGFGIPWMLVRELTFELVRRETSPNAPSRFESCFVCPTEHDLGVYRAFGDPHGLQVAHEVEYDERAPVHRGALSFIDAPAGHLPYLPNMQAQASAYWRGEVGDPSRGSEIVTGSPLRIIKSLD